MSRSCPRVMSPSPARSTLITSAPSHARSWVHVGPDCTCVKSRMRTPSSALPISLPVDSVALRQMRGRVEGQDVARQFGFQRSSLTVELGPPSWLLLGGWIETRDAAAFRAHLFVDDRVDERWLARADRFFHRAPELGRRRGQHAHATEGLHQFLVARALD